MSRNGEPKSLGQPLTMHIEVQWMINFNVFLRNRHGRIIWLQLFDLVETWAAWTGDCFGLKESW